MVRRRTCQAIIAVWLSTTIFVSLYYSIRIKNYLAGPRAPASTWECSGDSPRSRQCVVKNFCIDQETGGFVIASSFVHRKQAREELKVNLINADQEGDFYYLPQTKWQHEVGQAIFRNEKVFVYGLYSPEHYSHMLYNGLVPLYRTMLRHNATKTSWTYRAHVTAEFPEMGLPLMTTDFITQGSDIVLDAHGVSSPQQMLALTNEQEGPLCFREAVLGTGVACPISYYCEQPIESDVFAAFRDEAVDYYVMQDHWKDSNRDSLVHQEGRDNQACITSMNVTRMPNSAAAAAAAAATAASSLLPLRTIAIINRKGGRRVTNMQEVVDALTVSGHNYVIKMISFEEGCSLASTAYLMHDVDVLISPHGSQLGAAIFMKDNTVVLSINGRGYSEDWFAYPFTAMGRRFYNFECQSMECVETDVEMAKQTFERFGVYLPSDLAVEECASWKDDRSPEDCIRDYLVQNNNYTDSEQVWRASANYLKQAPRKASVAKLVSLMDQVMEEMDMFTNATYREICDQDKCCGYNCDYALQTNVYGSGLEGRMMAWPNDSVGPASKSWTPL